MGMNGSQAGLAAALAGIAIATAATGTPPAAAQPQGCIGDPGPGLAKLTLSARNIRSSKGEVAFTLYPDDRSRFLAKGAKLARARVPARAGTTEACFWLKPAGYAVAIYHDENGDRKFNRTLFSVKEGFGFSNNPPTTMGVPAFKSARFVVPGNGTTVQISTRYPG
jgi:uncharacterized protein (DUF2141 family)